ncbi:heme-binding protein [Actinoplanes sp. Pm04-4]|uniref:Heme-binding protein n=1 Tax=Paractinoplanes pyxinae TaxID=2997416 RepID=A0ABT4AQV1_9ACTN|nr:heme-binding protein [Actinoplanes pyxinae]MCY1136623.1 heme-binding protein [Actinoplanes pyxinae]
MTPTIAQISPVTLSLATATRLTEAAVAKASEIGIPYTITVIDGGGHVVLATRMDGAALVSIDTSVAKARTSVYFGAATADLGGAVQPGAPLFTIATATTSPLIFVAGGIPVHDAAGVVVGAIGAGGGSPEQDHEVAATAVGAL